MFGGEIQSRIIFHGMGNYMKFQCPCPQHRHTHHLWTIYGSVHAATTEVSSYNRDRMAYKAKDIYHLALTEEVC